jgi:hypothetical protein
MKRNNIVPILLFVLFATLFSVGCSQLESKGVLVDVREKITAEDIEQYKKVGKVACRNEVYLVTRTYNRQACMDRMRNSAGDLGADFIYIEEETKLPGFFSTGYEMRASAYKKKQN